MGFQTVVALEQAGLVEEVNYCLALSDHGRRTLSAAEAFKQSLERRAKDRWKRAAMMWLLRANGLTFREIGAQMGPIGAGRVQQIVDWYESVLRHRAYVVNERKGFEQRLAAAGAIPTLPCFPWDSHPMNVRFLDMPLPDDEES